MDIDLLLCQFQKRWWPLCSPCSARGNMFNLISNCCTWFSKLQEPIRKVTILVVGLDKAGKTSSIRGMSRVPNGVEAGPTNGCVRHELKVENYLVTLLDVGGSAESRGAWRELFGEAHGIIFVVDSSDRQRIKEVKEVLADQLKQPRVAGKPLLVLANKQDKMNALLGSELIEILSLEALVNQSRSLCHIEPCSALMDLRRWSDRKTLRGLRWLLRAVCLDYPELCTRVAQDSKRPLEPRERDKSWKTEKVRRKPKGERMRSSKPDLRQGHRPKQKEKNTKSEGKMQPIRNMLQKETSPKKKTKKKKRLVKVQEGEKDQVEANEQEEEEEGDGNEEEHENSGHREKASSALIPPKKSKLKRKTKVKKESVDVPESPDNDEKPLKAKGERRKKKKVVKVKRKNKINTEEMSGAYSQPVDLSTTFDLYRKAMLALKEHQNQGQ
ncbi:ADP-ribosylation factor-like protein 13A isoform X2 [Etheostoma cragini]|uniref:ADP-ribosylation factor-like protein 13A isoform X2 n=1 Tax=Etheostoma cragini TaxID=417921 RepID=UPI00155E91F0|nr:ADP-ribosylation factor-like protein 13A isoform X2 [Etheostoma cragini]